MSMGMFTEELKENYGVNNVKELRLLPYIQYLLVNHLSVDPNKIDSTEREILIRWRDEGKNKLATLDTGLITKFYKNSYGEDECSVGSQTHISSSRLMKLL